MADLDQIAQLIASLRALTAATNQSSAAQADVVALMERHGSGEVRPDDMAVAKALVALLKDMPAPQVTVAPAQVNLTAPPAVVTVQPAEPDKQGQQWRIQIERASNSATAPISALVVTRL